MTPRHLQCRHRRHHRHRRRHLPRHHAQLHRHRARLFHHQSGPYYDLHDNSECINMLVFLETDYFSIH